MENKTTGNTDNSASKKQNKSHRKSSGNRGGNNTSYLERKIRTLENRIKNKDDEIKSLKKQLNAKKVPDPESLLNVVTEIAFFINNNRERLTNNRELREISKFVNQFLAENEIKFFGRAGEKYNPSKHESLLFLNTEEIQPGKITEVKKPGLRKGRTIIRKAKVLVSKTRS